MSRDIDTWRDQYNDSRVTMVNVFAELTSLALRAGVSMDYVTEKHGRFFDANVKLKRAWEAVLLMAENARPVTPAEWEAARKWAAEAAQLLGLADIEREERETD